MFNIFIDKMGNNELSKLPNIGKTLAQKLVLAEITTPEQLAELGSENAFIRIKTIDKTACYNMLCALEGAIQGIRWHNLDAERKAQLKEFFVIANK